MPEEKENLRDGKRVGMYRQVPPSVRNGGSHGSFAGTRNTDFDTRYGKNE